MQEKLQIMHHQDLLFQINEARCITMDAKRVKELLDKIDSWCFAHNCSNGQLSKKDCNKEIDKRLKDFSRRYT